MNKLLLVTLLLVSGRFSQAFMVGTDVKPVVLDPVCLLSASYTDAKGISQMAFRCSGALVAPGKILTAGHCVSDLKDIPKLNLQVFCGYKGSSQKDLLSIGKTETSLAALFKETLVPVSADIDSKFNRNKEGSSSHDQGIIHLGTPSKIQPLVLLTPLESIQQFLGNGPQQASFQCSGIGFGLNGDSVPSALQIGDMTANDLNIQISFDKSPVGIMSTSLVVALSAKEDIYKWERYEMASQIMSQMYGPEAAIKVEIQKFEFLNKLNLISASIMPGDSGGPFLCRKNETSPWKIVGVASAIGVEAARGLTQDQKLMIQIINRWSTVDLTSINQKVWTSTPATPVK